jgi:hypothetical protein
VVNSEEWANLSAHAVKLLLEVYRHYNGYNNGNLSMPWSELKQRGWRSSATADKAKDELLGAGFLIQTRQGGKNLCSLFAVSFKAIDECLDKTGRSKCDAGIKPTPTAPGGWQKKTPVQAANQLGSFREQG